MVGADAAGKELNTNTCARPDRGLVIVRCVQPGNLKLQPQPGLPFPPLQLSLLLITYHSVSIITLHFVLGSPSHVDDCQYYARRMTDLAYFTLLITVSLWDSDTETPPKITPESPPTFPRVRIHKTEVVPQTRSDMLRLALATSGRRDRGQHTSRLVENQLVGRVDCERRP